MGFVPTQEGNGGKGGKGTAEIIQAAEAGGLDILWLLGADELGNSAPDENSRENPYEKLGKTFVVYQGHHGDLGASHADLVLPAAAWPEKEGLYVNTEGRVQTANRAIFSARRSPRRLENHPCRIWSLGKAVWWRSSPAL